MDSRKGKMIADTTQLTNTTDHSTPFRTQFQGLQLLSDTSLSDHSFSQECQKQREQVDQMIKFHCDSLKSSLVDALRRRAEETASKKLDQRHQQLEAAGLSSRTRELENAVESYKAEAERLRKSVKFMTRMNEAISMRLDEAYRHSESVESDAESSVVATDISRPVMTTCKTCKNRMARVILLPCRHLSVCVECEPTTGACPICGAQRTSIVKLWTPSSN